MHLLFGDGNIAIGLAESQADGVADILILDPDSGSGVLGQRDSPEVAQARPFNLNSAVLQFKNSASIDLLLGELQRLRKSLVQTEAKGWKPSNSWNIHLYLEPKD